MKQWAVAVFYTDGDVEILSTGTFDEVNERYAEQLSKESSIGTAFIQKLSDTAFQVVTKSGFTYELKIVEYRDTLHLNLAAEYFEEVSSGSKKHEFRVRSDYWRKRLQGVVYRRVLVKKGYPKANDTTRIIERPWRGYNEQVVTHRLFGDEPVEVFAIRVN